jgi:hypothetical protein
MHAIFQICILQVFTYEEIHLGLKINYSTPHIITYEELRMHSIKVPRTAHGQAYNYHACMPVQSCK